MISSRLEKHLNEVKVKRAKLKEKAIKRYKEIINIFGDDNVKYIWGASFRVNLKGDVYRLSFCYDRIELNIIETALIDRNGNIFYNKSLSYEGVLIHRDTVYDCVAEIARVENLLDNFAIKIQKVWFNYKKRKDSAIMIQRAFRKARYNPDYKLCEQIQIHNMEEETGCSLLN